MSLHLAQSEESLIPHRIKDLMKYLRVFSKIIGGYMDFQSAFSKNGWYSIHLF